MERRHALLVAMAAAAGLGAAGAAALVAADDDRGTARAVTVTLAQTTTQIATQEPEPATDGRRARRAGAAPRGRASGRRDRGARRRRPPREVDGGGLFGVLDDTAWFVCATTPEAGGRVEEASVVIVHVDRACEG